MVDSGTIDRKLPYGLLIILSRVSSAAVLVVTLHIGMQLYSIPFNEAYQALTIIVALLALILLPGSRVSDIRPGPNFWNNAVSVVSRCILPGPSSSSPP